MAILQVSAFSEQSSAIPMEGNIKGASGAPVFVTGGTGLIGSHLLYALLKAGRKVVALKRPSASMELLHKVFSCYPGNPEALAANIEWAEGDITDYQRMEELVKGMEVIYHCAGVVSFHKSDKKSMFAVNVEGASNLVNAAIAGKAARFCHVSSIAALGKAWNNDLVTEDTYRFPSQRESSYSLSKFFSEMQVWRGMEEGLDAVIINPSIVLGPGIWHKGSPGLFHAVWKGLKFYPGGETGFVDVRDVVEAMIMLTDDDYFAKVKNQRFILNAGNMSYREFFDKIADCLHKRRPAILASDLLLKAAWRAAAIAGFLTGRRPALTRDTAEAANSISRYDGSKITRYAGFHYRNLQTTISEVSGMLLRDNGGL